jgi:hypothetical protein
VHREGPSVLIHRVVLFRVSGKWKCRLSSGFSLPQLLPAHQSGFLSVHQPGFEFLALDLGPLPFLQPINLQLLCLDSINLSVPRAQQLGPSPPSLNNNVTNCIKAERSVLSSPLPPPAAALHSALATCNEFLQTTFSHSSPDYYSEHRRGEQTRKLFLATAVRSQTPTESSPSSLACQTLASFPPESPLRRTLLPRGIYTSHILRT